MNKIGQVLVLFFLLPAITACNQNTILDEMQALEKNQWTYAKPLKTSFEIKDTGAKYQVNFKLRINDDYRYANLFVLANFTNPKSKQSLRYQFKLAKADGEWLGKGSAGLYTYILPLKTNQIFADTGKYTIQIEQNMRENPLIGISDVGIEVLKQ